jgi:hypothetical protein
MKMIFASPLKEGFAYEENPGTSVCSGFGVMFAFSFQLSRFFRGTGSAG